MTIIDIIRQADIRQPNSIDTRQKLSWLWGLDMQLSCEMPRLLCPGALCSHAAEDSDAEGGAHCPCTDSDAGRPCGAESCCAGENCTAGEGSCPGISGHRPIPPYESGSEKPLLDRRWEELYCHYLVAQISAVHGETERYNRAIALYNSAYSALVSHYLRCRYRPGPSAFSI